MPWKRAKRIARALHGFGEFPDDYTGSKTIAELTALFDSCFRIQREASAAAGRHIPLIVENVNGAQPWVGRSRWRHGSFYLWGDVPALMPIVRGGIKNTGGSWFATSGKGRNPDGRKRNDPRDGVKCGGDWFGPGELSLMRQHSSKSPKRKAASAMIAKIPLPLAEWIGRAWLPTEQAA